MNYSTTNLLILVIVVASLHPYSVNAQVLPVVPAKTDAADPVADADFYLQKAELKIAELETFIESIQDKTSLRQVPFRPVMTSGREIRQASHTLGLAKAKIDLLPEHVSVEQVRQHAQLLQRVKGASESLATFQYGLQASLDPQAFPELKADAKRFRGIGSMFANVDSFETDPQLAASIFRQLPAAQQEVGRVISKYDILIQQKTVAGLQLAGLNRYFVSKRQSFEAIAKQQKQALPLQLKTSLEQVSTKLQRADADGSLIALTDQIHKIDAKLELLQALDPQSAVLLADQRKQLSDSMSGMRKSQPPTDNYTGDDRADLLKMLSVSATKPDLKSLRIPAKDWTRRSYWQYNGRHWLKIDRSVLAVNFLLDDASNNAGSSWQRFLLTKDHLDNDAISVSRN